MNIPKFMGFKGKKIKTKKEVRNEQNNDMAGVMPKKSIDKNMMIQDSNRSKSKFN